MIEDEATLRAILEETRTLAVVGIKSGETDDAYRVPRYMQEKGYQILPVNPGLDRVLNLPCRRCLADLEELAEADLRRVPGSSRGKASGARGGYSGRASRGACTILPSRRGGHSRARGGRRGGEVRTRKRKGGEQRRKGRGLGGRALTRCIVTGKGCGESAVSGRGW